MDIRTTIINETTMSLQADLTDAQIQKLRNVLYIQLNKYEIQERSTELIPIDDTSYGVLKKFLASKRLEGSSEKTIEQYRLHCLKFLQSVDKDVQDISVYDIRFYLANYKESRGISNGTLEHIRRVLGSFFSWMFKEEIIDKNPCAAVERVKTDKKILHPYSSVELEKLRRACSTKRDRALLEFLYATGCRVSEVVSLNRNDIDWSRRQVTVLGKGNKYRIVYLTDIAILYLQEYLESRSDLVPCLFYSQQPINDHRLTKSGIERLFHTIGKRAGVDDVHPHRFRRTFATDMIRRGVPIQDVSVMMGHDDISTTQVYCYISQQSIESEYQRYIA